MVTVIPAILTNDIREVEEKLKMVERASLAEDSHRGEAGVESRRVQIDIIDGAFAENKTIDPSALSNFETDLKLDFHLMTKEPVDWVERCVRGMADRIIGQVEEMSDQVAFVGKVQEVGLSVGLAIDLDTPVSKIDPSILNNLDVVLVMSVKAGFGGQKFDPSTLLRINSLDEIRARDDTPFRICVDGGIDEDNIRNVHLRGADEVAIGERIFQGDLAVNIRKFQEAAYGQK